MEQGVMDAARTLGVTKQTIYDWLDSYGMPRQGRSRERSVAAMKASWTM
jgi:transposase